MYRGYTMIELEKLNRNEAVRYLGGAGIRLNYRMDVLMDECEKAVLEKASPKYLYVEKDLPCPQIMGGKDIESHLNGCEKLLLCAPPSVQRWTNSSEFRRFPIWPVLW